MNLHVRQRVTSMASILDVLRLFWVNYTPDNCQKNLNGKVIFVDLWYTILRFSAEFYCNIRSK